MICFLPPPHSLLFFLVALLSVFALAEAKCYNPDGTASKDVYKPCNGTAQASMCCQIGASSNHGDACGSGSEYGLCGVTGTQLYRESCTDPTWKSPACLKLCMNGAGASGKVAITACQDGSHCCGQANSSCCDAGQGMFIVKNQAVTALPTITASISSAAPTSSISISTSSPSSLRFATSIAPTATPTNAEGLNGPTTTLAVIIPDAPGLSKGAKAGLGIGISILILSLVGIGFYFFRRYWQRKLMKYKGDGQDTKTILPGAVADHSDSNDPSRPNTSHTRSTTLETTSTKAYFGNEAPDIPSYLSPMPPISAHRSFSKDSFSEPWVQKSESKDSVPLETFAVEMDASTGDDRVFPINPHLVEMDAYEPRAVNDGVFEMPVWPLPGNDDAADTESTLGIEELFQMHDTERELTTDPNQLPTSGAEEKIFYTPLASPLDKESQGKETLSPAQHIAQARLSHGDKMLDLRPQDPLDRESQGLEAVVQIQQPTTTISGLQHARIRSPKPRVISPPSSPSHTAASPSITPVTPIENPIPEVDRSRSRVRTKSSSSIPKSQFSPSPSPTRTPSIPLDGMMSAPASIRERSVSRTRVPMSKRLTRGSEYSFATDSSSMHRSKTHIGAMVTDTRASVRPRKKSFGGKSPMEIDQAELLRSLEYRPEGSGSGLGIKSGPPMSPKEMPGGNV